MSFTVVHLLADVEDIGDRFEGPDGLEFRAATRALGLQRSALSLVRLPPGCRFPFGHAHAEQEEVYIAVRGSGRMCIDDEVVEIAAWDAVRVAPRAWRGYEAGPDGLDLLVTGAPNLGADPRADVDGLRGWWGGA